MTITSTFSLLTTRPQFTANSFIGGPQMLPDVLHLSSGGFVVAYNNHDAADGYIFLDFYGYEGSYSSNGPKAPYNTLATTSASGAPSLAQLENGNVVVVWNDAGPANPGIRGALFTQYGEKIGTETPLIDGLNADVHIEALNNGGFVLSYVHQNRIQIATFGANGIAANGPFNIDNVSGATVSDPTCTVLANGEIAVAWSSFSAGGSIQLHARVFDSHAHNAITSEITLDSFGHNQVPSIAALHNGNWAIAYADTGWGDENGSSGISLKILTADGSNALFGAGTIHVNAASPQVDSQPAVTVLDNGYILVTWNTEVFANSYDVHGRIFTQSGHPVMINGSTGEFMISSHAGNDTFPDAAALTEGRFLAAWTSVVNGGQEIAATIKELVRTTTGDAADDTITGDALRDIISSGGGNDTVDGGGGYDTIDAGAGNDTILVRPGSQIDGGSGDDTAVFSHNFSDYQMREYNDGHGIGINIDGAGGEYLVINVEHLQFADGTLHLADDGNPLFDTYYYLSHNPDVFHAGTNALDHFNAFGWHEGRDPNEFFDTSGYLAANPDVAASGQNPLEHYHQVGWQQGRDPGPDFDTTRYLIDNPDVAAAGIDPLQHYMEYGAIEGRARYAAIGQTIVNGFDAEYYVFHNPDVAAAGVDPLAHYQSSGWHEGRDPSEYFNTAGYLAHNPDVAAAGVNPLEHYMANGWQEGRDPSTAFDTLGYLAANPDVAAAHVNPLQHYMQFGIYEGRQIGNDWAWG